MGACLGHPCQGCAIIADKTVSLPLVDIILPRVRTWSLWALHQQLSSKTIDRSFDVVLNVDYTLQHVTRDYTNLVSLLGKRDHARDARGTSAGGKLGLGTVLTGLLVHLSVFTYPWHS